MLVRDFRDPSFVKNPHGIRPSFAALAEFHVFLLRLVAGPWSLEIVRAGGVGSEGHHLT